MKYLKVIVGLGLIPLGVFAGSFIRLGEGSGAIFGGVVGVILCCILFWSFTPYWPGADRLDEKYQDNSDKKSEEIDQTARALYETHIESDLHSRGLDHRL